MLASDWRTSWRSINSFSTSDGSIFLKNPVRRGFLASTKQVQITSLPDGGVGWSSHLGSHTTPHPTHSITGSLAHTTHQPQSSGMTATEPYPLPANSSRSH